MISLTKSLFLLLNIKLFQKCIDKLKSTYRQTENDFLNMIECTLTRL